MGFRERIRGASHESLVGKHGDLEQRLQELSYGVGPENDPTRPSKMLDRTGREVAEILSAIPAVSGMLNPEDERPPTLIHLRIVLSASELAMLPFEASKVPTGAGSAAAWLALLADHRSRRIRGRRLERANRHPRA